MGASPNYKFPWPELVEPADGPDGFEDLATAVDADMTRWRKETNIGGHDSGYVFQPNPIGTSNPQEWWYNWYPVVKGWAEIDITTTWFPQGGCAQGVITARFDDVDARRWIIHNDCKGTDIMMVAAGTVAQEFPNGTPNGQDTVKFSLAIDVAYNGSAIMLVSHNIMLRQFGART